jgi:Sec-independent protein translocase protein TatA
MGFGTEIFFFVALGVLVLGPKRLHTMIGHVTRAKARFEETTQALKSQLSEELDDKLADRPKSSSELREND